MKSEEESVSLEKPLKDAAVKCEDVHFQLQGTWSLSNSQKVDFIILKEDVASRPEIQRVYLSQTDVRNLLDVSVEPADDDDDLPYVKLIDLIFEAPRSKLVQKIFAGFLSKLKAERTVEVPERLTTPKHLSLRWFSGKEEAVPAARVKAEGLDSLGTNGGDRLRIVPSDVDDPDGLLKVSFLAHDEEATSDGEDSDDLLADDSYEGGDASRKLAFRSESEVSRGRLVKRRRSELRAAKNYKRNRPIADERRFFERCEELGREPSGDLHYRYDLAAGMTCLHCGRVFTSKIVQSAQKRINLLRVVVDHILVQHFDTHAYQCGQCDDTFDSVEPFHKHHKEGCAHKQHRCKLCAAMFSRREELKGHVRLEHGEAEAGALICSVCSKMYKSEKIKQVHERNYHNIDPDRSREKTFLVVNGGTPRVVCPTCGLSFATKWVLNAHMRKRHENAFPEPRTCELCVDSENVNYSRRKYYTPYALQTHMTQLHGDGPAAARLICEHCSIEFRGDHYSCKRKLKDHIDKVHLSIRHECNECGKIFMTSRILSRHKKHVHRKEGRYPCKACGKVFKYASQAVEHENVDLGKFPYRCKFCDFKANHSWAMSKHKGTCQAVGVKF